VQTVCIAGGSSSFTSSTTFTTTGVAPCNTPAGTSTTSITTTSATFNWGAVSGAVSYAVQYRVIGNPTWTAGTSATTSFNAAGLTSATNYEWQVQTVCSGSSSTFTASVNFTTSAISYCTSRGNNTSYEYISKVTLGTINNTSGDNGGYANYTAQSTNLAGGTSNTIGLTPGFHGSSYREYWNVWIDYNHNGVFTDAGEKVATGNSTTVLNLSFTVPTTALNGSTRMRVQMEYNTAPSSSCLTYTYGEVEDYSVNITGNAQSPVLAGNNSENIIADNTGRVNLYPNPAYDYLNVEFISNSSNNFKFNWSTSNEY
jgi:bacillolysin